jgi:acylphosphatase
MAARRQVRAVEVAVTGHVQGVFFRARTRDRAEASGVAGWVANRADGTVAARFEGPPDAVEGLVEWCRRGPERARVDDVRVTEAEPTGATGFDVR